MFVRAVIVLSVLALAACDSKTIPTEAAVPQSVAARVTDGPPMIDGIYVYGDCEGEGGCPNLHWRTLEPTPLLAQGSKTAETIGTLAPGEWVSVEGVETRLVPLRGVLKEAHGDYPAGETVYQLEYEGEGVSNYWVRGAQVYLDEQAQIEWETALPPTPAVQDTLGAWAKVRREKDGLIGWVTEPRFECMGKLAGDENCRE